MEEKKYAERGVYKVIIKAPIETVWSELVKTTSPRPFFWNSSWDARAMKPGNAYRMLSKDGKVVGVIGEILEMDPPRRMVTSFRLTPPRPAFKSHLSSRRDARRNGIPAYH